METENTNETSAPRGDGSDSTALVSLRCKCGAAFERPQEFVTNAKEYAVEYPNAARFFERKIALCDECYKERMNRALKCLPEILKTLAS